MNMHYCDIFSDCYRCPAPFCPYEKYEDDGSPSGYEPEEEYDDDEDRLA